jgi:hypothetical protein
MSLEVAVRPQPLRRHPQLRSVEATLNFTIANGAEKPFAYTYKRPDGGPQTNIEVRPETVRIEDIRPIAFDLDVDVEGVRAVKHRTAVRDFWDEAQTLALGHPETAELVKAVTGASRVVVFDHTLRRRSDGVADRTPGASRCAT